LPGGIVKNDLFRKDAQIFNPTQSILYFSLPTNWKLFNSLGQKLDSGNLDKYIDLSVYREGLYFVEVQGEIVKIIKNNL